MAMKKLNDLFIEELKDVYNAEKQITKAMPKMIKKASSDQLRRAFESHLKQTEKQIVRLEKVFKELGMAPKGKKCIGMEGIIAEGKEIMMENAEPSVVDAGLIAAAQKVEHYEICSYGTLRTFANQLGYNKIAGWLQETLNEEDQTDKLLTQLAENNVNVEAAQTV